VSQQLVIARSLTAETGLRGRRAGARETREQLAYAEGDAFQQSGAMRIAATANS
jgi:hypothetical protein